MTYWEDRFAQLEEAQNKTGMQTYQDIEKVLTKTQKNIDKEIEKWVNRIAKNNQLSMTEARKLLNDKELKEFKWDVKEYIKYGEENALNQKWMKELENASAKFHISRLEAMKLQTQQHLEVAFGNQLDSVDGMMRNIYKDNYYHTAFEIQKGLHIGFDVGQINENKLNKVLNNPWATDGKTFSDRIWTKKNQMVGELHQELTRQIIQGKSPDIAIQNMQKYVDGSIKNAKYNASRLVMTEQAFISSASTKDSYHDLDVEMYEILATLDSRTSEVCQDMDGKVFPTKDYSVGVTAPPFHVFCRTTTIPHFDDNYTGERIARDEDGKVYYVPDNMKYSDWKEHFVDKTKDPADWLKPVIDKSIFAEVAMMSNDSVEMWMNMTPEQQELFKQSGFNLKELFDELHGQKADLIWKPASAGDASDFAIKADFTNKEVIIKKVKPKSDGWMADANVYSDGKTIINVREDGIGDGWEQVIAHEAGHQLSNMSPELQKIIIQNPDDILGRYNIKLQKFDGIFGEYSPEEAFADAVRTYYLNPDRLKELYPKAYEAIDNLFTASPSARGYIDKVMNAYRKEFLEDVVKFAPAKTIKEAEEFARRFAENVKFSGITNLDAINEINERLLRLTEKYPIDKLDIITSNSRLRNTQMQASCRVLEFRTSYVNENVVMYDWQERIKRNIEKIEKYKEYTDVSKYPKSTVKSYKKYIRELEKENKFGRWTVDGDTGKIADTVTHEYGHIIADQYFGQFNTVKANPNFAYNKNNALYQTKLKVGDVFSKARETGDIYNISMYADTNAEEFFAEVFVMYVNGEELPDYIKEMMEGVLDNGKL